MEKGVKVIFSDKLFYAFVFVGILIASGWIAIVLSAGATPNSGHTINQLKAPFECATGQVLKWNESDWECVNGDTEGSVVYLSSMQRTNFLFGTHTLNYPAEIPSDAKGIIITFRTHLENPSNQNVEMFVNENGSSRKVAWSSASSSYNHDVDTVLLPYHSNRTLEVLVRGFCSTFCNSDVRFDGYLS